MASKTVTSFTDDLDGSEAAGTVTFALEGTTYEVDLSEDNTGALRDALEPFTAVARVTGKPSKGKSKSAPNPETVKIRTWAAENGYQVAERGRIPGSVREAYAAAGNSAEAA